MNILERHKIELPRPLTKAQIKSNQLPNPDGLMCYIFPMSQIDYKKNQKTIRSSLLSQVCNLQSISRVFEYEYLEEKECLLIIKNDFDPGRSLAFFMKSNGFSEIQVIDLLKQVNKIFQEMDFEQKSLKKLDENNIFVYETSFQKRCYKIQAFFMNECLLTPNEPCSYDFSNSKANVYDLAVLALKLLDSNTNKFPVGHKFSSKDLESFNISKVLKQILRIMLDSEAKRPAFQDLQNMYFFNPKAINQIHMFFGKKSSLIEETNLKEKEALPLHELFAIALHKKEQNNIEDSTINEKLKAKSKIKRIKKLIKILKTFYENNLLETRAKKVIAACYCKINELIENLKDNKDLKCEYDLKKSLSEIGEEPYKEDKKIKFVNKFIEKYYHLSEREDKKEKIEKTKKLLNKLGNN